MTFKVSLATLLFGFSLLPLLAYPAVLIANIMQVAALADTSLRPKGESPFSLKRVAMSALVMATTVYPLVVLMCHFLARASPPGTQRELAWSAAPLGYVAILAALVCLLSCVEAAERDSLPHEPK